MSANINFLPEEGDDKDSSGRIRKIEYTNPDDEKRDSEKTSRLGGVLSVFNRKKESPYPKVTAEMPMPPKPQPQPIVKTHVEGKKGPTKTVIVYKEKNPEDETRAPKSPSGFSLWLKNLFSRSSKKVKAPDMKKEKEDAKLAFEIEKAASQASPNIPLPPPPPAPVNSPVIPPFTPFGSQAPQASKPVPPKFNPFSEAKKEIPQTTRPAAMPIVPPIAPVQPAPLSQTARYTEAKMEAGPASQGLMFDVNLVPDELAQKKRSMNRLTMLGLVAVISIAAVGLSYGILAFYKQSITTRAIDIDKQIQVSKQQISKLSSVQNDALVLKARTDQINELLASHIAWEKLFTLLEKYTLINVQFLKMSVDANGILTLDGQAIDTNTAFEQYAVLQKATDFATKVSMTPPTIPTIATNTNATSGSSSTGGIPVTLPTSQPPGSNQIPSSLFTLQITLNSAVLKQALPTLDSIVP